MLSSYRVAILSGEEDPIPCHPRRLIGLVLVERGISLEHIRDDGTGPDTNWPANPSSAA